MATESGAPETCVLLQITTVTRIRHVSGELEVLFAPINGKIPILPLCIHYLTAVQLKLQSNTCEGLDNQVELKVLSSSPFLCACTALSE
jgi:hypothetical protein